ncbi:hypothetical protein ACICHK_01635 [Streptomyces sp. AHU1]|uniref:hypothetical protein n=1 Tax=Streptomyces sp. AHU1 TaxID=3377215 RepID=UPI0038784459
MLDDPFSGLDPMAVDVMSKVLGRSTPRARGKAFLILLDTSTTPMLEVTAARLGQKTTAGTVADHPSGGRAGEGGQGGRHRGTRLQQLVVPAVLGVGLATGMISPSIGTVAWVLGWHVSGFALYALVFAALGPRCPARRTSAGS